MRLVEVVVLMGAHCVSPVEHTQMMTTEVAKVQCAVVVEKDTDTGVVKVTPPAAAADPHVTAAIARFAAMAAAGRNADGTRIVPAFAPAGQPTTEIKPPPLVPPAATPDDAKPAPADQAAADPAVAAPGPEVPPDEPAPKVAKKVADTPPASAKKKVAAADPAPPETAGKASQCKGSAVPKWYTAADGHRKYRCVRPEPASDPIPSQIY